MIIGIVKHVKFFTWELNLHGLTFTPELLLVCQTFKVIDIYKDRLHYL